MMLGALWVSKVGAQHNESCSKYLRKEGKVGRREGEEEENAPLLDCTPMVRELDSAVNNLCPCGWFLFSF